MRQRHELTDEQWARLEPLLPTPKRGPQPRDRRRLLNGILWIHATGTQWRGLPERCDRWQSLYGRYQQWRRDGLWHRLLAILHPDSGSSLFDA